LAERVRRVKISADRVTSQIRFELDGTSMTLSAAGTEGSHAEDEIDVEYAGKPLVIGFNHNYVEDVLRHLPGENVVVALDRPDSATIFVPGDSADIDVLATDELCLLMPLRLND
jgi:DNA polymerase-3 subunit beta